MMSLLVESLHMRRSWYRYIFATPQRNGLLLPYLALLPPRVVSVLQVESIIVVSPVLNWFRYVLGIRCLYTGGTQCYMVITYSRVWINRVRLPILFVVS